MLIVSQDRKRMFNVKNIIELEISQIEQGSNEGKYAIYELDVSGGLEAIRILQNGRKSKASIRRTSIL